MTDDSRLRVIVVSVVGAHHGAVGGRGRTVESYCCLIFFFGFSFGWECGVVKRVEGKSEMVWYSMVYTSSHLVRRGKVGMNIKVISDLLRESNLFYLDLSRNYYFSAHKLSSQTCLLLAHSIKYSLPANLQVSSSTKLPFWPRPLA